MIFAINY